MVISVFEYNDYRVFLNSWLNAQSTRGLKGKLAEAMGVSSTLVSLILKGDKQLSLEQAMEASEYIGLNEKEADYFFLLVELGRAGSHKLQRRLSQKVEQQQKEAKQIGKRVKKDLELNDEQKAIYYSSWLYTGIRNLSALGKFHDVSSIAKRLNVSPANIHRIIEFLLEAGLCTSKDGLLSYGPSYTHISHDSPFVNKHHQNWRFRGINQMDMRSEDNLFYTCPMSLSAEAANEVRDLLLKKIQEVLKIVGPSTSEEVRCLNIDWFEY